MACWVAPSGAAFASERALLPAPSQPSVSVALPINMTVTNNRVCIELMESDIDVIAPHYESLERAASPVIGSERIRLPVAAKIALHSAGAMGGTPGSPTPPNGMSWLAGTI